MKFHCLRCSWSGPLDEVHYTCPRDGGLLEVRGDFHFDAARAAGRGVWRYATMLPPVRERVSLAEGGTPLVEAPRLASWAGVRKLWVKFEGANPTGSFKDRGMTLGASFALSHRHRVVGCASTGNTSASLAAYAARAGMRAIVLLPAGKVAAGKVAQAVAHGAEIVAVRGDFDAAMRIIGEISREGALYLLNSINPLRLEGQKTLMFEILEEREWSAPDRVVYPVGNAGNISAGWKALGELRKLGLVADPPKLTGVQAEGAAPIARAFDRHTVEVEPWPKPETVASAIRIGAPVSAPKALAAIRDSGGGAIAVPDSAILDAQRRLATVAGLFVEPASAAPLAGLAALVRRGDVDPSEEVVLVATGHGLKDPDVVMRDAAAFKTIDADAAALRDLLR
ncbi:MAG: threonine synthase [Thermoplasmatota archaeon]